MKQFNVVLQIAVGLAYSFGPAELGAQGIASINSTTSRPFVTGFTPIIGSNGSVGGVLVDANGVVTHGKTSTADLRASTFRIEKDQATADSDPSVEAELRLISLAKLDQALAKRVDQNKALTADQICLAGLTRVQYVIADPANNDLLIAGPAGAWMANESGQILSVRNRNPVVRLDDLMNALRAPKQFERKAVSCSIEPTVSGQQRYLKARARVRSLNPRVVQSLEQALGDQQVLLGGVDPQSHFAHVLLAADIAMKRLAMGFDRSPVDGMPSYLDSLARSSARRRLSSPRWWLVPEYTPIQRSEDRLVWEIPVCKVITKTRDSVLEAGGERTFDGEANPIAEKWADAMTSKYDALAKEIPVFAELRNCIDLSVVGALVAHEGLLVQADCELPTLSDSSRLNGVRLESPTTLASKASFVRGKSGWIVSVSGGVEFDPWSIIRQEQSQRALDHLDVKERESAVAERWWWDVK